MDGSITRTKARTTNNNDANTQVYRRVDNGWYVIFGLENWCWFVLFWIGFLERPIRVHPKNNFLSPLAYGTGPFVFVCMYRSDGERMTSITSVSPHFPSSFARGHTHTHTHKERNNILGKKRLNAPPHKQQQTNKQTTTGTTKANATYLLQWVDQVVRSDFQLFKFRDLLGRLWFL